MSLLDEAMKARPRTHTGVAPWHEKLRSSNPQLMSDIDEVIDAFNAGSLSLSAVTHLHEWFKSRGILDVQYQAFARYVKERHDSTD